MVRSSRRKNIQKIIEGIFALMIVFVCITWAPDAKAYMVYSVGSSNSGFCADCHGEFRAGTYTSQSEGVSWGTHLHNVHLNNSDIASGSCDNCHGGSPVPPGSVGRTVNLASSGAARDGVNAISCSGCHGRLGDASGNCIDPASDPTYCGIGVGLRQHHADAGETSCFTTANCHTDSGVTPVAEDVAPPFYAVVTNTAQGALMDSCNTGNTEVLAGLAEGLDNDGDGSYDGNDPDCTLCGDGNVDPGEDCDGGACCEADCSFSVAGTACADGQFCNGDETCDGAGACDPGTPVNCDDVVACTDDTCNEGTDSCDNVANDANCDDGLFCNGTETCDAVADCQAGAAVDCDDGIACTNDSCNEGTDSCDNVDNCPPGESCNLGTGLCVAGPFCGDGNVDPGEDCDGGLCCEADCSFSVAGTNCDDGLFCTNPDTCDGAGTCGGPARNCSDGVACTDDNCNEAGDTCVNTPNNANCPDDGLFCNGNEVCDAVNDCVSTGDPCGPGTTCNEATDNCDLSASCGDGNVDPGEDCDSTECCEADCTFTLAGTPCTDDGQFCNGEERCDGAGNCASTGDPCPAGTVPPNREGAHTPHNALNNVTGDCDTCHNGAGSGTSSHFNGTNDIAFSGTTYGAKSILPGQPTHDSGTHTCSGISCHGGQDTPDWFNDTIDVNTECTLCHQSRNTADEFNSYFSGEHDFHISFFFCTLCHDTAKLPTNHFTNLNTSIMEGPASATIRDGLNYDTSVSPPTCSPGPACHFDDNPAGTAPRDWD